MPHWKLEGATYFITFRVAKGELSEAERKLILNHIVAGDARFYDLLGAVIMPDHGHMLITPKPGYDLSRIMKGTKGATARLINEHRKARGTIWQDESFDRIMRDQDELDEKLQYMVNNPVKAELVDDPWEYCALYVKEDPG